MLQYKLQQAECMWGACAVLVELQYVLVMLGWPCMRQLCGMKVMLWCSSAAERCSALGTADSSLSCLDLCQLTLALPLLSLRTSMAEAENQIQSRVGSAYHSDVVCSLAFLGLFGNSVPLTVRVSVVATRIEIAYHLNAVPVCPSSPSQHFKVSFSYDYAAALLYFPYSHISHVPKTELP